MYMKFRDLIPLSLNALLVNKSRSALTMLGIVIGIGSVILMISVGQSAQGYLLNQIASFGSDVVFVANGKGDETRGGPPSATIKQTLTEKDFKKLRALPWVTDISGDVITNDLVTYANQEKRTQISGCSMGELRVFNTSIGSGRFIDDQDLESRSRVIVLGSNMAEQLFGQENPLGKTVKVAKQPFRVVGVMAPAGTRFFTNYDNQVYIPFTTFFDLFNKNRLNFISLKSGKVHPGEAKELIRVELRELHNIENPQGVLAKDDFRVATQEDAIRNASVIGSILSILLGSIASISLFVAGIGIMNIMYVTVTERTREIGLRKAIGAHERDILGQFLSEAVMMTFMGGCLGVLFGILLSWLSIQIISHLQSGWSFVVPWSGIVIGFGVSSLIGILFGYFPARRAARLHPIDALRYE
jgi:putative ABC transport system permease protein